MMKTIYALVDPSTKEVRYVGQTVDVVSRLAQHCGSYRSTPVVRWVRRLSAVGLRPIVVELETAEVGEHLAAEKFWIDYFRFLGAELLNLRENGFKNMWAGSLREIEELYPQYVRKNLHISGRCVEPLREAVGMSRRDLAAQTDKTPKWVRLLETGSATMGLYRAHKLATALGVSVDDLSPRVSYR